MNCSVVTMWNNNAFFVIGINKKASINKIIPKTLGIAKS